MNNLEIQGLISQIFQSSNMIQYQQPKLPAANGNRPPTANMFDTLGQTSQSYLFSQVSNTIENELLSIFNSGADDAVTSVANAAAGEAAESVAANAAGSTGIMSTIGSALAGIGGILYGGYQIFDNWGTRNPIGGAISGATLGAGAVALGSSIGMGAMSGAWAGPIGMGIGALVGGLFGFIRSGKHEDQIMRDNVRDVLRERGVIDENWTIGLADGSRFDIGIDGGPKKELGGRRPFEVDSSQAIAGDVVGLVHPFVAVMAGGNQKILDDFTGYFTNAALSNANGDIEVAKKNVQAIFQQMGMSPQEVVVGMGQLVQNGKMTELEFTHMLGGFRDLLSTDPYVLKAPPREPATKIAA